MEICPQVPYQEYSFQAWEHNSDTYSFKPNPQLFAPFNKVNCCVEAVLTKLDPLAGAVDVWCGSYWDSVDESSAQHYFGNKLSKVLDRVQCPLTSAIRMVQNSWYDNTSIVPQTVISLESRECTTVGGESFEQLANQNRLKYVPKQFEFGAPFGQTGNPSWNRYEVLTHARFFTLKSDLCQRLDFIRSGNFSGILFAGCQVGGDKENPIWEPELISAYNPEFYCYPYPGSNQSNMYLAYTPIVWDKEQTNVDAQTIVNHTLINCKKLSSSSVESAAAHPGSKSLLTLLLLTLGLTAIYKI